MALSTLTLNPDQWDTDISPDQHQCGLWDSDAEQFIYVGPESTCDKVKHDLEQIEQAKSNKAHLQKIYAARLQQLTAKGGVSEERAKEILKHYMPELHQQVQEA